MLPGAARQLQDEVAALSQRHHREFNGCLEKWLKKNGALVESLDLCTPPGTVPRQLSPPDEAGGFASIVPIIPDATLSTLDASVQNAIDNVQDACRATTENCQSAAKDVVLSPRQSVDRGDLSPRQSVDRGVDREALVKRMNEVTREEHAKGGHHHLVTKPEGKKKTRALSARRLQGEKSLFEATSTTAGPQGLQKFVRSQRYEAISSTLIILNSVFIGWQVQWSAEHARDDAVSGQLSEAPLGWFIIQTLFCFCFVLELAIRWSADGPMLFWFIPDYGFNKDVLWNLLDVIIVTCGVLDFCLEVEAMQNDGNKNDVAGKLSVLRVLRVLRIVRLARVIRVMRFFRELRMMVFSILGSLKSVFWVVAVLGLTFYIFGISFTTAVTDALDSPAKWLAEENADLIQFFGTVDRSILTLYMSMSGGEDWGVIYSSLSNLDFMYRVQFLTFITFTVFAVVNIVTGVFVENAMQANTADREIIVHEELNARAEYLKQMRQIFEEMDDDDRGTITLDEFEKKLDDDRVVAYFNAMKLDVSEARVLFRLLDFDQSEEISITEFLEGCYRLQGESRSLDMKIMQYEVRFLQGAFLNIQEIVQRIHDMELVRLGVMSPAAMSECSPTASPEK